MGGDSFLAGAGNDVARRRSGQRPVHLQRAGRGGGRHGRRAGRRGPRRARPGRARRAGDDGRPGGGRHDGHDQAGRTLLVGAPGQAANLEDVTAGGGDDVVAGNAADNDLNGLGGNDTVSGGAGNDVLGGSYGSDSLLGAAGDDVYRFDDTFSVETDTVVELAGEGRDRLDFGGADAGVTVDLAAAGTAVASSANRTVLVARRARQRRSRTSPARRSPTPLTGNAADNRIVGGSGQRHPRRRSGRRHVRVRPGGSGRDRHHRGGGRRRDRRARLRRPRLHRCRHARPRRRLGDARRPSLPHHRGRAGGAGAGARARASAARLRTCCAPARAPSVWRAAPARTRWTAARATTRWTAGWATTRSRAAPATTSSRAASAATRRRAGRATTATASGRRRARRRPTWSRRRPAAAPTCSTSGLLGASVPLTVRLGGSAALAAHAGRTLTAAGGRAGVRGRDRAAPARTT